MLQVAIDLIQSIAAQAWDMEYCPKLSDYPAQVAQLQLPLGLTLVEQYQVSSRPGGQTLATARFVTKVLFVPIEAEEFGPISFEVMRLQDAFVTVFTDKDTYSTSGMFLLRDQPERITIQVGDPTFTFSGPVVEYPIGTDLWFHGFEMRYQVVGQWPFAC